MNTPRPYDEILADLCAKIIDETRKGWMADAAMLDNICEHVGAAMAEAAERRRQERIDRAKRMRNAKLEVAIQQTASGGSADWIQSVIKDRKTQNQRTKRAEMVWQLTLWRPWAERARVKRAIEGLGFVVKGDTVEARKP